MSDTIEAVFCRKAMNRCRENFGSAPRRFGFWEYFFGIWTSPPSWLSPEDGLSHYWKHQRRLLETGEIVWGQVVQANIVLLQSGSSDAPGDVIYCTDRQREILPSELKEIAARVGMLKKGQRDNPAEDFIGSHLANERTRLFGVVIPESISPELPCALSTIYFNRSHLPTSRLTLTFFPMVVREEEPRIATVLPLRYWPEELKLLWKRNTPKNWFVERIKAFFKK